MSKIIIKTPGAPTAIGPYSQAVRVNHLVFISGQIPMDPETGMMISGDISSQTHRVLKNIQAICEASGGSLSQVVKTTIFLTDLAAFSTVNSVYATYFTEQPPARSTVQVAALPRAAQIEIEAVLSLSDA